MKQTLVNGLLEQNIQNQKQNLKTPEDVIWAEKSEVPGDLKLEITSYLY